MSVGISLGVDRYKSKRRKGGGGTEERRGKGRRERGKKRRRRGEKKEGRRKRGEEKHTLKGRLGLELDGMISIKQSIKRSYNIR